MTNWDERANDLRQERRGAEASERQAAAEAEAKEHAESQAIYDRLADVSRWAIGRYQIAGIRPTAIYVEWDEQVQISRPRSRIVRRKNVIEKAYEPRKIKVGEAYELSRAKYGWASDEAPVTSVLMVTPGHHMIWHDNSEICVKPAQPGIRALDLVCPVNDFFADDITIWSKSRPTNNLTDYMHLVENHSVMKISYCFQSMSLTPKPPSEELDKFLNEIVEFVDRRTRS